MQRTLLPAVVVPPNARSDTTAAPDPAAPSTAAQPPSLVPSVSEPALRQEPNAEPLAVDDAAVAGSARRDNIGSLSQRQLPASAAPANAESQTPLPPLRQLLVNAVDMTAAEKQRRVLAPLGLKIHSRKTLAALGLVISVFRLPETDDPEHILQQARALLGTAAVELNQRYALLASAKRSYAQLLVHAGSPSGCRQSVSLAMLDSQVNATLPLFSGRVVAEDATGKLPPPHEHGTAVAGVLVSDDENFPGLLPKATLLAVNVFADDGAGGQETRTDWLLTGLERVAQQQPLALNLSFGGAYSQLMDGVLKRLSQHMVLIAAAGNQGTDTRLYPAAYDSVVAVGGVDARGLPMAQSNFGSHVALKAPGEDIWMVNQNGRGFYASGTSFAAPFATAALALVKLKQQLVETYLSALPNKQVNFASLCLR